MTAFGQALGLVFVAELADKSRLVGLLLVAAFPKKPWPVFLGMTAAYAVLDGAAAFLGARLTVLVPPRLLSLCAGGLFVVFGLAALALAAEAENKARDLLERWKSWGPLALSFAAVGLGELGDRTQLATAALAGQSGAPWAVFGGAMTALAALNLLTVWAGEALSQRIPLKLIQKAGGVVFLAMGLALLFKA